MDEPYNYEYDEAGKIAYDSEKYYEVIGIDPGGMGDESRNMKQGIPNTKTIKNQPHMLAYITPGEAKDLEKLGGRETMTPEGIPAYPEWDSMYGASSKADFDKGKAPKGNVNWSGGNGGNNNSPKSNLIDKNPTLVTKDPNKR